LCKSIVEMITSYFGVDFIQYNLCTLNKLVCRIIAIGNTPPISWDVFADYHYTNFGEVLPFRDRNYEIHFAKYNIAGSI